MSAREFFNNNPAIVTGGAVLLLVIALSVIACSLFGGGSRGPGNVKLLYFDISNETIVLVPAKDRPDSPLAENSNAYRAVVRSCTECDKIEDGMSLADLEAKGMFVAYVMDIPSREGVDPMMSMEMNLTIMSPAEGVWVPQGSQEGIDLDQASMRCPDNTNAKNCHPQ